jgi:hypothetical protein
MACCWLSHTTFCAKELVNMMISIEFKKGKNEFNDFGRHSETSYIVAGLSLDIADVEAC